MEKQSQEDGKQTPDAPKMGPATNFWLMLAVFAVLLLVFSSLLSGKVATIRYDFFREQVEAGNVQKVTVYETEARGQFKAPPPAPPEYNSAGELKQDKDPTTGQPVKLARNFRVKLPDEKIKINELLDKYGVQYEYDQAGDPLLYFYLILFLLPLGLLLFMWLSYRRTRDQLMGGGFLSGFSKSPAKRYEAVEARRSRSTTWPD